MLFRQYELGCLSLYSYLVGDTTSGRAVVIDPQRDIGVYVADAAAHGLRIERVIETHFHADFVSGHLELARATGATVSYGPGAEADFPIHNLAHGQRLSLGEVVLEVRATPGHTPESISVVVWEHRDDRAPWAVLTGDTLFIGDVGRPDLLASPGVSAEHLAGQLYHSLHEQLLTLPDSTVVFPAHGAGSACGRAMSSAPSSTMGAQRRSNYALAPMTEEAFVAAVIADQPLAPTYFPFAASTNRRAHELLDEQRIPEVLSLDQVLRYQAGGAAVVDTRPPQDFASGYLKGALNVSLDGRFRRVRRGRLPPPAGHHHRGRPGPGGRGQDPPGPHRLRHRMRLSAPHRGRPRRSPRPGPARPATAGRRSGRLVIDRPQRPAGRRPQSFRAPGRHHRRGATYPPTVAAGQHSPARPRSADGGGVRIREPLFGRRVAAASPRV